MVKVVLAFLTAASILAAAFVLLPKLLLKTAPGANSNENVPVGKPLDLSATPGAQAQRRVQSFADIAAAAGFTPLTPSSLPAGYQPWEQYYQAASGTVVVTYRKSDRLYLIIAERKLPPPQDPNGFRPRLPTSCATPRGEFPTPTVRRPTVQVAIPMGTACAFYQSDAGNFGFAARLLQGADLNPAFSNLRPHQLSFATANDLEVAIEADQQDVMPDQLVQIAEGLR
jgi:hypothetical protein